MAESRGESTGTPHPAGLPSKWLNRTASELVEAYGEPDMILETAVNGFVIYGDTYSIMYVYTFDPEHRRGCFAAYVVEHNTGLILRYQCRYVNRGSPAIMCWTDLI